MVGAGRLGLARESESSAGETWLDCAVRMGDEYGLGEEVREAYERHRAGGAAEEAAAFYACSDWDVCLVFVGGSPAEDQPTLVAVPARSAP